MLVARLGQFVTSSFSAAKQCCVMPNGLDLSNQYRWGGRAILISYILGGVGFFLTMFLWISFDIGGLVTGLMVLFLGVFIGISGVAERVATLYLALRGTRDESGFTESLRN